MTQNVTIDIDEYIACIKKFKRDLTHYANLDSIGNAEKTLENQRYMESKGLRPIPCYHRGEDISYLKLYIKEYDYIALGGTVVEGLPSSSLPTYLDRVWSDHICDESGMPRVKVHGFGVTALDILVRYPWYSVDSTAWVMTGRFGAVFVPKMRNGKYVYTEPAHKVTISEKSPTRDGSKHFKDYSLMEQEQIIKYFTLKKCDKDELGEHYQKRDEINIMYFIDLEKNLPAWPWKFELKSGTSLGLV